MPILIYISWACYAAAVLCIVAIISTESLEFLVPAIAAAVSGVLFAALERIIDTLIDIRNAVAPMDEDGIDYGDGDGDDSKTASMLPSMQMDSPDLVELAENRAAKKAMTGRQLTTPTSCPDQTISPITLN